MATGTTTSNRECLFRLQILILDGGTVVLRNIFDQRLPNKPLDAFLAQEQPTIKSLRVITKTQYDQLFPASGQQPRSSDFDITLIVCLLRNLRCLGLNHKYNWNTTPQPEDMSVEADLCRLKGFRNEVAHISSTFGIQPVVFQTKWTEIEQTLLRLNSSVPNPIRDLKETIDSYKNVPLDPVAETRIQKEIEHWQELEKAFDTEIPMLKKDARETKEDLKELKEHVNVLQKDVTKLKTEKEYAASDSRGQKKPGIFQRVFEWLFSFGNSMRTEEQPVAEVQNSALVAAEAYLQLKTQLQYDLINFYRNKHTKILLTPLIEEKYTPLLAFYVMPDIKAVRIERALGGGNTEKTLVEPLRNVFYKENNICHEIYLTADAGLGKTAFSKRLALTWCQAKQPIKEDDRYFSGEEIEALAEFDFIFLLLLRESSSECDIDDMILTQIVPELSHTSYTLADLENVLSKESCLIILDGLDEWTHSSNSCKHGQIPHRKARKCTVLTTSRPWKLSVSGVSSNEIDQRLEITGLSPESANALKRSVISHLSGEKDESKLSQYVKDFSQAVQVKNITDLEAVPLLLIYLLFLWHDKIDLGQSLSELYSNIIELLLSRTVHACDNIPLMPVYSQGDIPQCLRENELCRQSYDLLKALGHLAFQTLLRETKVENTLVFDSSVSKKYLSQQYMTFCLKTGIITQSKVQGKLIKQESKVSFAHKTVQEFFAALYISSEIDQTSVLETVLSKCKCVKDILEMSKIVIFLSGLNGSVSFEISGELARIINEDEITREYRSCLYKSEPLKQFQDMCVSCCKELPRENEVRLCLQDVFIDESCWQEQYRQNLKQLTTRNKQNIRSVYIVMSDMCNTPCSTAKEVVEYFAFNGIENINKIRYSGGYNDNEILPLISTSVKSLSLTCNDSFWSHSLSKKVTNLQKLESINIVGFKMGHEQLTLLFDFISGRHSMREIALKKICCTEHEGACTGCSLDLRQHSQLMELQLGDYSPNVVLPVSELNINMSSVKTCDLWHLSKPHLKIRFLSLVPEESKVTTFECKSIQSSVAIESLLQTLSLLVHVKHIWLEEISIIDRALSLSADMLNIERVVLCRVKMSASDFRVLVEVIQQLPQAVTVNIRSCNIIPERDFETVKEKIKTLQNFRVLVESRRVLEFKTIEKGDRIQ